MAKKPPSYAEQLAAAGVRDGGVPIPSAESIQLAQQRKALQSYVGGVNTRRFCVEQAVIASKDKPWDVAAVMGLAREMMEFMQDDSSAEINPPLSQ